MQALLVLAVLAYAGRLVTVQLEPAERTLAQRSDQIFGTFELAAPRGAIRDRTGAPLAVTHDAPSLFVEPVKLADPAAAAALVAPLIDRPVEELAAQWAQAKEAGERFRYVQRLLPTAVGDAVTALKADDAHRATLVAVGLELEPERVTPAGDALARSIVGATDDWHVAISGIEQQYDGVLAGQPGQVVRELGRDGTPIAGASEDRVEPVPGTDVVLTLDSQTQWLAERELVEAVQATGAASGVAVVMHTGTGELLALASVDRDPATGIAATSSRARAVTDSYEPGSVNKPFTLAAALEEGVVSATEVIDVPRAHRFSDKTFVEPFAGRDRRLTPGQILESSSNIGTILIAERVTAPLLHDYLQKFGFGARTGPDGAALLSGEQTGVLHPVEEWQGVTMATIAFGQGVSVTPLQLATAYNTIANGGEHVAPTIVRGTQDATGAFTPAAPPPRRQVISAETAATLTGMLQQVVEGESGTGGRAAVPGYEVAGKTGTAQKASETGGYSPSDYVATFAGFVPADDPQLTIVVALDEPTVGHLAGQVAAPLFADLARHTLGSLRIPPNPAELAVDRAAE
jgi:cell division protein FtsI (penicillin-binding protein 3)